MIAVTLKSDHSDTYFALWWRTNPFFINLKIATKFVKTYSVHSNSLNNHPLNLHQGITFWWKHKTKWRSWPKQWQHFNQYPHPDRSQHEIEWNLTVCTQWIPPKNWSQSVLLPPVLLTVVLIVTFQEIESA